MFKKLFKTGNLSRQSFSSNWSSDETTFGCLQGWKVSVFLKTCFNFAHLCTCHLSIYKILQVLVRNLNMNYSGYPNTRQVQFSNARFQLEPGTVTI
jgi:hypothetical protein